MEYFKRFFAWVKKLPRFIQILVILSAGILTICFGFTSCGATNRVVVQTDNNSSVSVNIEQKPSTDVDVSPDVDASYNPVTRTLHIRRL